MKTQHDHPPNKAAGRAEARPADSENTTHPQASSQTANGKPYLGKQAVAEDAARQLIYSWTENGLHAASHFPPEKFPTVQLGEIAEAVAWAAQQGARGMTDVMALAFIDAPEHVRGAFVECCEGFFPPSPTLCRPLVEMLESFHREKRKREIGDKLRQRLDGGDEIGDLLAELRAIDSETATVGIGDMLAQRAFDFEVQPPRPVARFTLAGSPLCTPGNITNVQAAPKAGKSAVVDAMLAAVMNGNRQGADTLNFSAENPTGHALIHFDTEQSRFDADALVRRAIRRANLAEPPSWFCSYSVADLGIRERREALRFVMSEAAKERGGIFAVMIDGIGDLCADPNDSEEAFGLVGELHTLAITYDCAIATVLHENPGSENGKTRGHLGSQLERKAETNLRLAKDKDGITTIWAEKARHCYLPKGQGPCFTWSDEHKMHVSCGTAGEIRQAANREKMEAEADAAFGGAEHMTYSDLVAAIADALDVSQRTAKSRVKTWLAEGITRKDSTGKHRLVNG